MHPQASRIPEEEQMQFQQLISNYLGLFQRMQLASKERLCCIYALFLEYMLWMAASACTLHPEKAHIRIMTASELAWKARKGLVVASFPVQQYGPGCICLLYTTAILSITQPHFSMIMLGNSATSISV